MSVKLNINLNQLKRRIADTVDEVDILELLDIHADELVEAFSDKIEERMDQLVGEVFDEPNGDFNGEEE